VQRISDQDIKPFEPKRAWNKKVSFVDEAASSDSDEEPVIGLAEWVKNKKSMSCPFGHKEPEKFAFDITKADRIFDFLLQEGQIKLSPNHVIPSAEELKKMKYCKWYNATSHSTNECKVFRQQLQSAIEYERIKFDNSKAQKPMKIDQHPFPTNMLDAKGKTKVLTSEAAERSALVDPQHQITAADAKGKCLIQEGNSSGRPPRYGIVITHRRHRETWQQREDHWNCTSFIVGKRKDADRSGIGTKITGTARPLSIAGNKTSNCLLLGIALNAMVMIGMTDPIGTIKMMIGDLMGRLGEGPQFMINWGASSVYMIGLVIVWHIFPGTRRSLKRWPMHEFSTNSYFVGTLILIGWNRGKVVAHRQGSHNFLHGVQRG